eukprot:3099589-Prymnesium_polylepis.1
MRHRARRWTPSPIISASSSASDVRESEAAFYLWVPNDPKLRINLAGIGVPRIRKGKRWCISRLTRVRRRNASHKTQSQTQNFKRVL